VHEVVGGGVADVDANAGNGADVDEALIGVALCETLVGREVGDDVEAVFVGWDRRACDEQQDSQFIAERSEASSEASPESYATRMHRRSLAPLGIN
jgi:hypothetical protein